MASGFSLRQLCLSVAGADRVGGGNLNESPGYVNGISKLLRISFLGFPISFMGHKMDQLTAPTGLYASLPGGPKGLPPGQTELRRGSGDRIANPGRRPY